MTEALAVRATSSDQLDRVVDILVGAFDDDPTWAWAFPDPQLRPDQYRRLWRLAVAGAERFSSVWLNAEASAAAVWIPPGGTELSVEQAASLEPLLVELVGGDSGRIMRLFGAFDDARPAGGDYYYLSLLGTDPRHRGRGAGLRLLEETLRHPDDDRVAAYLESSNPANVALYARYGFQPRATIQLSQGGPKVTTMWRDPRS